MPLLHPGDTFPDGTAPMRVRSRTSPEPSSTPTRYTSSPPGSSSTRRARSSVSVYSSGAIGRLVPDDVAGLVR